MANNCEIPKMRIRCAGAGGLLFQVYSTSNVCYFRNVDMLFIIISEIQVYKRNGNTTFKNLKHSVVFYLKKNKFKIFQLPYASRGKWLRYLTFTMLFKCNMKIFTSFYMFFLHSIIFNFIIQGFPFEKSEKK